MCSSDLFNVHAAYQDKRARLTYAQMALGDDGVTIRTGVMWRSWESLKYPDNAVGDKAEIWDKTQSDDHAFDAAAYALSPQVREGYHPRHDGPSAAAGWHGV